MTTFVQHVPLRIGRNAIHGNGASCLLEATTVRGLRDARVAGDEVAHVTDSAVVTGRQWGHAGDAQGKSRETARGGADCADQEVVVAV